MQARWALRMHGYFSVPRKLTRYGVSRKPGLYGSMCCDGCV